jgi:hypothetical protein
MIDLFTFVDAWEASSRKVRSSRCSCCFSCNCSRWRWLQ